MNDRQRHNGVTLIELLCALAVFATVTALAVPAFGRIIARNELAVTTNHLLSTLMLARTLAITHNVAVTFCAGNADAGCHGDWSRVEWIAFVDANRNGQFDDGETLQVAERRDLSRTSLAVNGPFRRAVVFRPNGLARWPSGAFAAGRLRICAAVPIAPNANDLVLIGSGRAVIERHQYDGACPQP